jgi:FkbM family methyltransferase
MKIYQIPCFVVFLIILVISGTNLVLSEEPPKDTITLPNGTPLTKVSQNSVSFYTGPMFWWCQNREPHVIKALYNAISQAKATAQTPTTTASTTPPCVMLDVGMNDGFYTQFSAAQGCRVFSFELQRKCIHISKGSARHNHHENLVTIIGHPVTNVHNKLMEIPVNENECDGLFSVDRQDCPAQNGGCLQNHQKDKYVKHAFTSVALSHLKMLPDKIDFVKIDVEGHDPQVCHLYPLINGSLIRMTIGTRRCGEAVQRQACQVHCH